MDSQGNHCGDENYDTLLNYNIYEYTSNRFVYKDYVMPAFNGISGINDPKGEQIITVTGNADAILKFENRVLKSFSFEYVDVLYKGLNDNIDTGSLDGMNQADIEEAAAVRDDILTALQEAFAAAGMEVNIDETTGEVLMDNNILFAVDSCELSEEGKAYVDKFVEVYASVLLSEEYEESVSSIYFEGHTDSSGEVGYNQNLSQKRAETVLEYCLNSSDNNLSDEERGKLENLSIPKGYGSSDLIYDEEGQEDAEASRRAAIKFMIKI